MEEVSDPLGSRLVSNLAAFRRVSESNSSNLRVTFPERNLSSVQTRDGIAAAFLLLARLHSRDGHARIDAFLFRVVEFKIVFRIVFVLRLNLGTEVVIEEFDHLH